MYIDEKKYNNDNIDICELKKRIKEKVFNINNLRSQIDEIIQKIK